MNYKLIAIDCDNTLLDEFGNICDINKQVIKMLKEKGIEIVIATGRNDILAKDYLEELELEAPMISCNGAVISNVFTNEVFCVNAINSVAIDEIFDFCADNRILFKILTTDACYTNDEQAIKLGIKQIVKKYTRELKYTIPYHYTADMNSLRSLDNILKVVIIDDDKAQREKIQQQLARIKGVNVYTAGFNCIDIISSSVSKGQALKQYAEKLGIKKDEIISFGDGENDLSMIEFAGLGVAMINGDECLKNVADLITEYDNTNGGVGRTLAKIFDIKI